MRSLYAPLIKLIIFLVITAVMFYVLATTISNKAFGSTSSYHAIFSDVSGLSNGDDVRIAGVRVGTVDGITLLRRDGASTVADVTFTVARTTALPRSAEVIARYRNLVGQRYLDVEQGAGSSGTLAAGGTIPLSQTQPALDLTVLFQGFQPLVQGLDANQLNELSLEIIKTLQGESGSLDLLFANLADLTNSIADKDHAIGEVVDNLDSVLRAVATRDDDLSQLIVQLRSFVSGLAKDRFTIGHAIDGVNRLATSTAGLLTQARAPLAKDITDLTGLVGNLNRNTPEIRTLIRQFPATTAALVRTASYGSWFNFYLCSVDGTVSLPGGFALNLNQLPASAQPSNSAARCH